MESKPAPYLLFFRDRTPEVYGKMSDAERSRLLDSWNAWFDGLVAEGKIQDGKPLENEGRVIQGAFGERVVDGPYPEAKEAVLGYFLLDVNSLEDATEIARRCPLLPHGMSVEIRQAAGACHLAHSIGRQTMKALTPV